MFGKPTLAYLPEVCVDDYRYDLWRVHPRHHRLVDIRLHLVGFNTVGRLLFLAMCLHRLHREEPVYVRMVGGSTYGAFLPFERVRRLMEELLQKLALTYVLIGLHFCRSGRLDYHVTALNADADSRILVRKLRLFRVRMRRELRRLVAELNAERLKAGEHSVGNLDERGRVFFVERGDDHAIEPEMGAEAAKAVEAGETALINVPPPNLTVGNLNSAWMVNFKEREPKMEREPEKAIGEPGPAVAPALTITATQPAAQAEAPVVPQVMDETSPQMEETKLAEIPPGETSISKGDGERSGSRVSEPAVPSGTSASKFESAGSVGPAVTEATPTAAPSANKPILTPAQVVVDLPARKMPVTAPAVDRLGKSHSHAESVTSTSKEAAQSAGAGPAVTKERAPSADDSSGNSKDDDEAKRKREADAALIRRQQEDLVRLVEDLVERAGDAEEMTRDREADKLKKRAQAAADALLARETAALFENLVSLFHRLDWERDPTKVSELGVKVCSLCSQLLQKHNWPLPKEGSKDRSALIEQTVVLAANETSEEAKEFKATAQTRLDLLNDKSVEPGKSIG